MITPRQLAQPTPARTDRLLGSRWGGRSARHRSTRAELTTRWGKAASRIHLLGGPALDISASHIRRRVAAERAIRYLVPRAVEELIIDRRLYRR
jgi:nicotinic acid mononucleotide adenylyltransferase